MASNGGVEITGDGSPHSHPRGSLPLHPFPKPSDAPSSSMPRRQSSRLPVQGQAGRHYLDQSGDGDRLGNAEGDDGRRASVDLRAEMMGFEPPPPRPMPLPQPHYRPSPQLASDRKFHPDQEHRTTLPGTSGFIPRQGLGTPPRERLPSSASMSSVSLGRRAAAPAALDLSPESERQRQAAVIQGGPSTTMRGLGYGPAPSIMPNERRALTETYLDVSASSLDSSKRSQSSSHRFPRPLPPLPSQGSSSDAHYLSPRSPPMSPDFGDRLRLAVHPEEKHPAMWESSPRSDEASNPRLLPQLSQARPSATAFSPSTPDTLDPYNIDRRTLIGVGELATPRWGASTSHQHMRTPSMPQPYLKSSMLRMDPSLNRSDGHWSREGTGLGLGMDAMEGRSDPSSVKDVGVAQQEVDDLASLLATGSLGDFDFDSSMAPALAASLSLQDEPRRPGPQPSHAPAPLIDRSIDRSAATMSESQGSPGSARSRIYARRQERERWASALIIGEGPPTIPHRKSSNEMPVVPHRSTSKLSPPNSADSKSLSPRLTREVRKTPPGKDRDSGSRTRQSPTTAHHDILRHFAPKDFSHLPPSPSSASINQFLRGSGSINNFASASSPPGTTMTTGPSYFSTNTVSTAHSKTSLQQSDSGRVRSMPSNQKIGWEGKDFDPDTTEAMRKLDGLGGSSGRPRAQSKIKTSSSTESRPGTPPRPRSKISSTSERKLSMKASTGSLRTEVKVDSPLKAWIDVADNIPVVPPLHTTNAAALPPEERESSSSTGCADTPSSRDSQSLPTASSSTIGLRVEPKIVRRSSGDSDVSEYSDAIQGPEVPNEKPQANIPPVPPLPKGYMSMRQGLSNAGTLPTSYTALQGPSPGTTPEATSPLESGQPARPRLMNKKWSFSSAMSFKKDSASPPVPPGQDDRVSPQTPNVSQGELTPPLETLYRSNQSVTPTTLGVPKTTVSSKRLTSSSIPFFRRASSSSQTSQASVPEPPAPLPATQRVPSGSQAHKSVLGMHMPSMLRGSSSKRGLSQQLAEPTVHVEDTAEQARSTGWKGRKRGKTLSISDDAAPAVLYAKPSSPVTPQAIKADSSRKRLSADDPVNGTSIFKPSKLPAIMDSPHLHHPSSTVSLREASRDAPSETPTKIPRMTNRPSVPSPVARETMPPPAQTHAITSRSSYATSRTMANTSSLADLARPSVNEFGSLSGQHSRTAGSHRAHLLAPMSSRAEVKKEKVREPLVRKTETGGVVPPSRRNLPIPPPQSQSMSGSSRPGASRHSSKELGSGPDEAPSGSVSPMKPSKSLHAKLSVPNTTRMPSSSSMGTPGTTFRHTSLITESPSGSPTEDDEAQANAEMQEYVHRRKARRGSSSAKKDDLADITAFPEDVSPAAPISQRAFISSRLASMSDYERKEVLDFDNIYYTPASHITRPLQPGVASYNHGYDDERGDYLVVDGDHLCYRYEVVGIVGKGSFGQVVQCRDHRTGGSAAVKIIRNKKRFHAQALVEVKILQQLAEWDPEDKHYMVRMTDNFYFRGHLCIVTELLSINLYELIKANQFAGFSTTLIRRFTSQMLASLQLMRSHRIVHCDLKPENILLCHPVKSGIKIIDFGSSCLETEKVYTYIQSRFYRSPEVILGMNYAMAIDMWSLGCILAELFTGVPVFPGENEQEQLACIMEVLGVPDRYIVEKASRRKLFFDATGSPRPFVNGKGKRRRPSTRSLAAVLKCDDELFVDFISKCLTWDPDKRLKPQPAMRHPWILAGRRRIAQAQAPDWPNRLASPAQPMRASARNISEMANGGRDREKAKQLLISPPTPLMARQASAPRVAHSISSSRLPSTSHFRNSNFMSAAKVTTG